MEALGVVEVEELLDERIDQSHQTKRPSYHSPPDSRRAKRTKIGTRSRRPSEFSKAEKIILRGAAKILDISLEQLREVTGTPLSVSRNGTSFESDSASSSCSEAIDGAPPDIATTPFALKLPHISQRARQNSRHHKSTAQHLSVVEDGDGANNAVIPWLSGLTDYNQESEFWNNLFPTGTSEEDSTANMYNIGTGIEQDDWFHISPLPREALDYLHVEKPDHSDTPLANPSVLQLPWFESQRPNPDSSITVPYQSKASGLQNPSTQDTVRRRPKEPTITIKESTKSSTKRKHRGPFLDSEQRQETGLTRRLGACMRCSMQRIRCFPDRSNLNGCCLTCIQAVRTNIHWLPCLRYKISDAHLLDHGECPRPSWTRRWTKMEISDIRDWDSTEIKTIAITQDVGGKSYNLKVRKFIPVEGDALERRWKTAGVEQTFKCAPYAIADMKEAGRTLSHFADRTLESTICHYIDETDTLLRSTYHMAYRYSMFVESEKERHLLRCVFRLWCASRMESRSDRICSNETLGMEPGNYEPACPNSGIILVPPVLSAQMEIIVTTMILQPMKKEVLQGLKYLIQENQRRYWFTIYLCMFILLHSCALLSAGDEKKARKQGLAHRFFRQSLVEGLHNGSKILLAYFHYCNKGSHPFMVDWESPEQRAKAELNAEQVEFMKTTAVEIKKRAPVFQKIREDRDFGHELYFLAQLYDHDWKPVHTI